MIKLEPLRRGQYRQVAEWEFGPQPEDTDWGKYESEMSHPKWLHLAIYDGDFFIGCLSLEKISDDEAEYHVVTARHAIKPGGLVEMLLGTAVDLFNAGFIRLTARIPASNRAATRLALRCGMTEVIRDDSIREFELRQ